MYYIGDNVNINPADPLTKYMSEAYKVFMCLNNNPFIHSAQNTNSWRRNNNSGNNQSNSNSTWQQYQQRPRRNSNSPEDVSYRCDSKSPSPFVEKRICFICQERGHIAVNCSKREDFKVEASSRKSPNALEIIKEDENLSNSSNTSTESNEIEELEKFVLRKSEAELKSREGDLRRYKQRLKNAVDNARSQDDLVVKTLTTRVKDTEGQIEKLKVKCEQYRQTIRMFKQMRMEKTDVSKKQTEEEKNECEMESKIEKIEKAESGEKVENCQKVEETEKETEQRSPSLKRGLEDKDEETSTKKVAENKDNNKESIEETTQIDSTNDKSHDLDKSSLRPSLSIKLIDKSEKKVDLMWDLMSGDDDKSARDFDNYEALLESIKEYQIFGCLVDELSTEPNDSEQLIQVATVEPSLFDCTISDCIEGYTYYISMKIRFNDDSLSSFSNSQLVKF